MRDASITGTGAGRRQLAYAVLLCLAGAGLALFATSRTWAVEVTARPGALSDLREPRTGADAVPWLPALAVVALAAAGALVAVRGRLRRALGALLLGCGAAVAVGAGYGLVTVDRAGVGAGAVGWPLLALVGGAVAAGSGLLAVAHGHRWPALGARYARPAGTPPPERRAGPDDQRTPADTREVWEALDRGEDPTAS